MTYDWRYHQPVSTDTAASEPILKDETLLCDNCGEVFQFGEDAVEVFLGVVGRGPKSGQPMVVDGTSGRQVANLHLWCVSEFAGNAIYEDQFFQEEPEEEAKYCAACEAKLEGGD